MHRYPAFTVASSSAQACPTEFSFWLGPPQILVAYVASNPLGDLRVGMQERTLRDFKIRGNTDGKQGSGRRSEERGEENTPPFGNLT